METEKPLHVRVAEALGWSRCPSDDMWHPPGTTCGEWTNGHCCEGAMFDGAVPRYDTDWSATGPLIERYQISIVSDGSAVRCWSTDVGAAPLSFGATPLAAVCNLILALAEAGRLNP